MTALHPPCFAPRANTSARPRTRSIPSAIRHPPSAILTPPPPIARYLSIDLGDKRTGLAVGDAVTRIVSPLEVLEVPIAERAGEALLDALIAAVNRQFSPHSRVELVIGLPLNMDGTEGPRAKLVRDFAARLASRLTPSRAIHFQDERLTSADADWQLARSGKTHKEKKQRRDALAAAAVLRDFLEAAKGDEPTG